MVDKDRAVRAMVVIMMVNVGLDLPEVWEDLLEAPLVVAIRGPEIKVLGHPRWKAEELTALDPPVTLPLGTGIGGAVSVALATNCQLCLLVKREMG